MAELKQNGDRKYLEKTACMLGASSASLQDVNPVVLSRFTWLAAEPHAAADRVDVRGPVQLDPNASLETADPAILSRFIVTQGLTGDDKMSLLDLYEQMAGVRIDRDSVESSFDVTEQKYRLDDSDRNFLLEMDRLRMNEGLRRGLDARLKAGETLNADETAMREALNSPQFEFAAFMEKQFPLEDGALDDPAEDFVSRLQSLTLEEEGECSTDSMPELV